jgi:L-cysteine desulfidase
MSKFIRCSFLKRMPKQEIHYISATKTNRLMMFMKTIAVYCENHMKYISTLCGQNAEMGMLNQVEYEHIPTNGL